MDRDQPLPLVWLLSDARNDARLEAALTELPQGSGFVFRHYHLAGEQRRARFDQLAQFCAAHRHLVILSGDIETALAWGAAGVYGPIENLANHPGLLRLATVHNGEEIDRANQAAVDGMFLSPVFPSRSHPDGATLGAAGFHILAQRATRPVIALGGMNAARAAELDWPRWAAIDGLS